MCLVIVKAYGNSPRRLIDSKIKKMADKGEIHGAAFSLVFWNISFKIIVRVFFHIYLIFPEK